MVKSRRALPIACVFALLAGLALALARTPRASADPSRARLTGQPASLASSVPPPAPASAPPPAPAPPPALREVVFLHGAGERPEAGCESLRAPVREIGWLLCPRGNLVAGRGYTWGGGGAQMSAQLAATETATDSAQPGAIEWSRPGVMIAFSQGAYVAMEVLATRPGRASAALFIGASVQPSKIALTRLGVSRVGFAAGRYDQTYAAMKRSAEALAEQGLESRFFDLGAVGHTYAAEDPETLIHILRWLATPAPLA